MAPHGWKAALAAAALAASGAAALAAPQDDSGMGGAAAPPPKPPADAPAAPAGGDVLILKDGTEIRGRIASEDETAYAVKVGGALRLVEKEKVKEVRRGAPGVAAEETAPGAPGVGDEKDRQRRKAKKRFDGEGPPPGGVPMDPMKAPPPLSPDAEAWARTCVERILSGDPAVQKSAAEALRVLGPAAFPLLREARAGADEKGRAVLDRVAEMLSRGPGRKKGQGPDGEGPPGPDGKGPPGLEKKGPMDPPFRGRGLMERVRTELMLDEASSRTVGMELLRFGREMRETLMDARDGLISYEEAKTKVGEMRGKLRETLKSTLAEDQLAKLDAILDDMAPKRPFGGPPAPPKPPQPPPPGEPK